MKKSKLTKYVTNLGRKERFNAILGAAAVLFGIERICVASKANGEYRGITKATAAMDKWHNTAAQDLDEEAINTLNNTSWIFPEEFK